MVSSSFYWSACVALFVAVQDHLFVYKCCADADFFAFSLPFLWTLQGYGQLSKEYYTQSAAHMQSVWRMVKHVAGL